MEEKVKVVQKRKEFDIKASIPLPAKIGKHKVDNYYLITAPEKASFIATNEIGNQFVDYFKKGYSIEKVINTMKKNGYKMDAIVSELREFLIRVEKRGFYEDAVVNEVHNNELSLHLDLTTRCNLTCIHCLRDAGKGNANELTTSEWLKIIDTFSSMYKTNVCVSGGEPLLHPGIFDILKRAKERGLKVTLFTNGTLINSEAVAKKLGKSVDKIQVSLDGATKDVNDNVRGKGCFEKVVKAVHLLKKTKIVVDISISIMPQNVNDLHENIEKLAKMLGPKVNLRISPATKEGRATSAHVFPTEEIAQQELRKLMGQLYQKRLKVMSKNDKNVKLNTCGFGETVVVSDTGDVFPCNIHEARLKYGNVRENDLTRIIEKVNKDRLAVSVEEMEGCKSCDLRFICFGGCRLNNIYRNNDLYKPVCSPGFKNEICTFVIEKERTFDPLALWLAEDKAKYEQTVN